MSGIRVGVDASWFIVLFLMIYLLSAPFRTTLHSSDTVAYLTTVVSVLLLFASLIVHELGHALAARRQGIGVERIDLYLFGGLTLMNREPETPGEDFKIAVAGPLATAAMIVVFIAADFALVGSHRLLHAIELAVEHPHHPGAARAQLADSDQRAAARLQPAPGVPARRRPDRARRRLAGDRRSAAAARSPRPGWDRCWRWRSAGSASTC